MVSPSCASGSYTKSSGSQHRVGFNIESIQGKSVIALNFYALDEVRIHFVFAPWPITCLQTVMV